MIYKKIKERLILQQVQDERREILDLCLLLSLSKHQDERKGSWTWFTTACDLNPMFHFITHENPGVNKARIKGTSRRMRTHLGII